MECPSRLNWVLLTHPKTGHSIRIRIVFFFLRKLNGFHLKTFSNSYFSIAWLRGCYKKVLIQAERGIAEVLRIFSTP